MLPLLDRFLAGDRLALARLISRAENRDPEFTVSMDRLYPKTGRAYRIGVTGPPGAGKSTIVDGLAAAYRKTNETVGVLAVDPTSPFTGGALLGDRIRMRTAEEDPTVFVRSMATRGSLGGLARASVDAADLLDAFGFQRILLETVGVGQAEHDVVSASDTVLVVLYPGGGDSVQAMKAGLMEIADVFVVNKSDHDAADRLVDDIEQVLELRGARGGWKPPVVKCVATQRQGIDDLAAAIDCHKTARERDGNLESRRRARREEHVMRVVEEEMREIVFESLHYKKWIGAELLKRRPPYSVAAELVNRVRAGIEAAPNV